MRHTQVVPAAEEEVQLLQEHGLFVVVVDLHLHLLRCEREVAARYIMPTAGAPELPLVCKHFLLPLIESRRVFSQLRRRLGDIVVALKFGTIEDRMHWIPLILGAIRCPVPMYSGRAAPYSIGSASFSSSASLFEFWERDTEIIIFVVSDSGCNSPGAAAGTWYRGRREPAEHLPECSNRSPSASKIRRTVPANRSRRGSQLELWYSMSTGRFDSKEAFVGARFEGNFLMVVQKVFCGLAVRSRAISMQSTTSYVAARPALTSPGSPYIHSRNGRLSGPVSTASPVQLWSWQWTWPRTKWARATPRGSPDAGGRPVVAAKPSEARGAALTWSRTSDSASRISWLAIYLHSVVGLGCALHPNPGSELTRSRRARTCNLSFIL